MPKRQSDFKNSDSKRLGLTVPSEQKLTQLLESFKTYAEEVLLAYQGFTLSLAAGPNHWPPFSWEKRGKQTVSSLLPEDIAGVIKNHFNHQFARGSNKHPFWVVRSRMQHHRFRIVLNYDNLCEIANHSFDLEVHQCYKPSSFSYTIKNKYESACHALNTLMPIHSEVPKEFIMSMDSSPFQLGPIKLTLSLAGKWQITDNMPYLYLDPPRCEFRYETSIHSPGLLSLPYVNTSCIPTVVNNEIERQFQHRIKFIDNSLGQQGLRLSLLEAIAFDDKVIRTDRRKFIETVSNAALIYRGAKHQGNENLKKAIALVCALLCSNKERRLGLTEEALVLIATLIFRNTIEGRKNTSLSSEDKKSDEFSFFTSKSSITWQNRDAVMKPEIPIRLFK